MEESREDIEKRLLFEKTKPLKISFWANVIVACAIIFSVLFLPIFATGNGIIAKIIEIIKGGIGIEDLANLCLFILIAYVIFLIVTVIRVVKSYKTCKWGKVSVIATRVTCFGALLGIILLCSFFGSIAGVGEDRLSLFGMIVCVAFPILGAIVSIVCNIKTPLIKRQRREILYVIMNMAFCVILIVMFSCFSVGKIKMAIPSFSEDREFIETDFTLISINENVDAMFRFENGGFIRNTENEEIISEIFESRNDVAFMLLYNEAVGGKLLCDVIDIISWGAGIYILIAQSFWFFLISIFFIYLLGLIEMKTSALERVFDGNEWSIKSFRKEEGEMDVTPKDEKESNLIFAVLDKFFLVAMWVGAIGGILSLLNISTYGIVFITVNLWIPLIMMAISKTSRYVWKKCIEMYK